eukprot:GCRY01001809.1.p1 GENE.GCRY01001809.1~~GCRY01001809.1.p1  ORF type:complete len:606 (+),score=148.24 GCRY01001809.1:386-2203(+)
MADAEVSVGGGPLYNLVRVPSTGSVHSLMSSRSHSAVSSVYSSGYIQQKDISRLDSIKNNPFNLNFNADELFSSTPKVLEPELAPNFVPHPHSFNQAERLTAASLHHHNLALKQKNRKEHSAKRHLRQLTNVHHTVLSRTLRNRLVFLQWITLFFIVLMTLLLIAYTVFYSISRNRTPDADSDGEEDPTLIHTVFFFTLLSSLLLFAGAFRFFRTLLFPIGLLLLNAAFLVLAVGLVVDQFRGWEGLGAAFTLIGCSFVPFHYQNLRLILIFVGNCLVLLVAFIISIIQDSLEADSIFAFFMGLFALLVGMSGLFLFGPVYRLLDLSYDHAQQESRAFRVLLHNMLPGPIVRRIIEGKDSAVLSEQIPQVTFLIINVNHFLSLMNEMGPHRAHAFLNLLYERFDELVDNNNCHFYETYGDRYIVTSGAPEKDPRQVEEIFALAMDILEIIPEIRRTTHLNSFSLRLGMHTGPARAGLVRKKNPQYELLGPTVSMASILEITGEENALHTSEEVMSTFSKHDLELYHLKSRLNLDLGSFFGERTTYSVYSRVTSNNTQHRTTLENPLPSHVDDRKRLPVSRRSSVSLSIPLTSTVTAPPGAVGFLP